MEKQKKRNENVELYQEVLNTLQQRTSDPNEIMTALMQATLIVLKSCQTFYGDRDMVRQTAKDGFDKVLAEL